MKMRKLLLAAVLILLARVVCAGEAFALYVRCFDFIGSITADDGNVAYYKTGIVKEWRALGPTDFVLDMPMPESYTDQAGVLKLLSERMITYCKAHPTDELARVEATTWIHLQTEDGTKLPWDEAAVDYRIQEFLDKNQ
jgi:hypothetical protein